MQVCFRDGGPFMFAVLALGLLACVAAAARIRLLRTGGAPGLMVGAYGLLLGAAVLGLSSGIVQAFKAVAASEPALKEIMLAAGLGVAAYPPMLALLLAVPLLLLHAAGDFAGHGSVRPATPGDKAATVVSAVIGLVAVRIVWGCFSIFVAYADATRSVETSAAEAAAISEGLYALTFEALVLTALGLGLLGFGLVVGVRRAKAAAA